MEISDNEDVRFVEDDVVVPKIRKKRNNSEKSTLASSNNLALGRAKRLEQIRARKEEEEERQCMEEDEDVDNEYEYVNVQRRRKPIKKILEREKNYSDDVIEKILRKLDVMDSYVKSSGSRKEPQPESESEPEPKPKKVNKKKEPEPEAEPEPEHVTKKSIATDKKKNGIDYLNSLFND